MKRFCLAFGLWLLAAGAHANTPGELVNQHSSSVLQTLTARRDEFRAEPAQLHAYVRGELSAIFDREYAARLVLGRHARSSAPEQISAFAEALIDNLLRKYGDAMLDFDPGLSVRVKAETPMRDGSIVRVASEVLRRAGAPVPVDYMFRKTAEGWRAFDVIVEGVSYVQTYRNQFDEQLRRESLDSVTRQLRDGRIDAGA